VAQEPAVGVERHLAVAVEIAGADARGGLAALCEAEVFEKHRECDRKTVVDGSIANISDGQAGCRLCFSNRNLRAELTQRGRSRDMLMGVRLGAAAPANAGGSSRLAADDERGAAVRDRAAVQQF